VLSSLKLILIDARRLRGGFRRAGGNGYENHPIESGYSGTTQRLTGIGGKKKGVTKEKASRRRRWRVRQLSNPTQGTRGDENLKQKRDI